MKKILNLIFCVLCFVNNLKSQNLVPNESFEVLDSCPNNQGRIYLALPWFQPCIYSGNTHNSSSSDIYNPCALWAPAGVPVNMVGSQFARIGVGYAGIHPDVDTFNYREYIEVPLLSPLIANKLYCVKFYVSLAETSHHAISNMGAYFSNDSLLDTSYYHAIDYVFPQIENPGNVFLNDTANWVLVWGNFIATGGERFMTIGNFHNHANTNVQNLNGGSLGNWSYYYIDDVSVIDCDSISGVKEMNDEMEVSIAPNPAKDELRIKNYELGIKTIKIYNLLSECVYNTTIKQLNTITIDIAYLPKGIYFIEVQSEKGIKRRKFVKE